MNRRAVGRENAIRRAKDWGIDISLIEENLRLSPTQRLEKMISMQRFVEKVQSQKKKNNASPRLR
jgi:hypothetical protein